MLLYFFNYLIVLAILFFVAMLFETYISSRNTPISLLLALLSFTLCMTVAASAPTVEFHKLYVYFNNSSGEIEKAWVSEVHPDIVTSLIFVMFAIISLFRLLAAIYDMIYGMIKVR